MDRNSYRVIVKPVGLAENLILDGLDSNKIGPLIREVEDYMRSIGYKDYRIESINRVTRATFVVAFEDINLN